MDHPDTQQQAPLIANRDHEEDYEEGLDDAVGRAAPLDAGKATSPGLFMWLLTFSAGIGGLLFGCTSVNPPPLCNNKLSSPPCPDRKNATGGSSPMDANNKGTEQMTRA